ncbi:hypothetical protein BDZ94DRAFT_1318265 [Collybia nuda]|uniref:Uncharacterized protein n=1 Tax=Collybia nuda TaxID=64659 RepID=A0A9P5YDX2_9AGAR|nr:hypothetical protein BDZ94DRAFT_1318265 [Collybia nuda]
MPGANYMGGKRNAAKTRSKDTIGRIQKGFFSKRRLDMLSQGLARNQGSRNALRYPEIRETELPEIGLAHAKHSRRVSSQQDISRYMLSPTHFSPRTPSSREASKNINQASSSTNSTQTSKVIEALDTSEPLFFRATMDRILALPDLAGLMGCCTRPRIPVTPTGKKRLAPYEGGGQGKSRFHGTRQYKKQKISSQELENAGSGSSILKDKPIDTPRKDSDINFDSPSNTYTYGSPFQSIVNHPSPDVTQKGFWSLDINNDDIGYYDCRAGLGSDSKLFDEGRATSSLKKGFRALPSSSHSSNLPLGGYSSPISIDTYPSSLRTPNSYDGNGDAWSYSCVNRSPASNTKNPPGRAIRQFSPDNLFDHKDPWHTIGVILGLSPVSQIANTSSNSPNSNEFFTNSRTESHDLMSTGPDEDLPCKTSLPPSSPPLNYCTPSKPHVPDSWMPSPEPYESHASGDNADFLLSIGSNSLVGSPSIFGPEPRSSPGFGWIGYYSSSATAGVTANYGSPTKLTDRSPAPSMPVVARIFSDDPLEIGNTNSTSNDQIYFGSKSNKTSAQSLSSIILWVKTPEKNTSFGNTQNSSAVSNVSGPGAPSPSFSGKARKAFPVKFLCGLDGSDGHNDPCSVTSRQALQAPAISILSEELATSPKSSTSKYTNGPFQLLEVDGIYQGPCLFPEDPDLGSDSDER